MFYFLLFFLFSLPLSGQLRLTAAAYTIDVKCEAILTKTLQVQLVNDFCHFRGLDLGHLATHGTYLMAVAVVVVAGLVARGALKAVTNDQTQLQKQVQRVVERGPLTGKLYSSLSLSPNSSKREVTVHTIHSLKNRIALRRLAMVVQV